MLRKEERTGKEERRKEKEEKKAVQIEILELKDIITR
jgi:hypothetical protein